MDHVMKVMQEQVAEAVRRLRKMSDDEVRRDAAVTPQSNYTVLAIGEAKRRGLA